MRTQTVTNEHLKRARVHADDNSNNANTPWIIAYNSFIAGSGCPSEETARKIWDAAYNLGRMDYDEKDFKNFYKQLIEGK